MKISHIKMMNYLEDKGYDLYTVDIKDEDPRTICTWTAIEAAESLGAVYDHETDQWDVPYTPDLIYGIDVFFILKREDLELSLKEVLKRQGIELTDKEFHQTLDDLMGIARRKFNMESEELESFVADRINNILKENDSDDSDLQD